MDDQARKVLDTLRLLAPEAQAATDDTAWLSGFRYQTALLRAFSGQPEPLAVTLRDFGSVPVRTFRAGGEDAPILFHVHGGGGIAGSLDDYDPALRMLATSTGWTVMAPDYRLAPEHRFPVPLDDCFAALAAVRAATPSHRIVVSGDSIGGTLATALAMRARDGDGPPLSGQILFYPNTDLRHEADYPSRRSEDGNIIALEDLERQITLYMESEAGRSDPLASPILAKNFDGLPDTLIATCECDPLRDEGEAYAHRLRDAGVLVEHHRVPGMIHAFLQMAGYVDATEGFLAVVKRWLDDR